MLKSDTTFNADEILMIIQDELMTVMENNGYNEMGYDIKISLERQFVRREEFNPKTIYVVVKFGESELNYGQLVAPFTITAITEENDIDIGYKLFLEFSEKYNLKMNEDGTMLQAYTSPTMSNSFQFIAAGYRPILYMSGTFLISKNINRMSFKYVDGELYQYNNNQEKIPLTDIEINNKYIEELIFEFVSNKDRNINIERPIILKYVKNDAEEDDGLYYNQGFYIKLDDKFYQHITYKGQESVVYFYLKINESSLNALTRMLNMDIQLDTQGFYNTNNYTKSEAKLGTLAFSVSTNLLSDSAFCNKCLDIITKKSGINNSFLMKIQFSNSSHSFYDNFKAMTFNIQENAAALPLLSVSLTN